MICLAGFQLVSACFTLYSVFQISSRVKLKLYPCLSTESMDKGCNYCSIHVLSSSVNLLVGVGLQERLYPKNLAEIHEHSNTLTHSLSKVVKYLSGYLPDFLHKTSSKLSNVSSACSSSVYASKQLPRCFQSAHQFSVCSFHCLIVAANSTVHKNMSTGGLLQSSFQGLDQFIQS